jgi:16S rRNA processing protein RimM
LNHNRALSGKTDQPAGSPTAGEPAFFEAGLVRRPHGVKGELLVEIDRHYLQQVQPGKIVYVGEFHQQMDVISCRQHNLGLLIHFEGITNPEQAGQYRLQNIYVSSVQRGKLPAGEYYIDQLLGLRVRDNDTEEQLGLVSEVIETGANDVYVISDPGRPDLLLPAIQDVIKGIDLEKGEIFVHILPGLIESQQK